MTGDGRESFSGTPRYAIVRRLGQGGTGVVYEAADGLRDERVALKTLRFDDATRIDAVLARKIRSVRNAPAAVLSPRIALLMSSSAAC